MNYQYEYPRPSVTLDAVILRTPQLGYPEILLIKRGQAPFVGHWALPGGFMEMDEKPLSGAARELAEETGLQDLPLKPLFACGEPGRDPRGRTMTMIFGCLIRDSATSPIGSDDAAEAAWFPLQSIPKMAFDHQRVLSQIEQNLVWQAKTSIIGRDVFHDLASSKDIIRLHQNITGEIRPDFIEVREQQSLIKCRNGICEYTPPNPAGPDWQPLVW